jgi:hypothetical protein
MHRFGIFIDKVLIITLEKVKRTPYGLLTYSHTHHFIDVLDSQQQAQWEKAYYGSLRPGLVMAMVARVVVLAMGVSWLRRRFH